MLPPKKRIFGRLDESAAGARGQLKSYSDAAVRQIQVEGLEGYGPAASAALVLGSGAPSNPPEVTRIELAEE